jgi:hypothetical protein
MCFVESDVITAVVVKISIFFDVMPCRPLKVNDVTELHPVSFSRTYEQAKKGTSMKQAARISWLSNSGFDARDGSRFTMIFSLDYSSTLKIEVECSSETSVDLQRTTRRYVQEDISLLEP